MAEAACLDALQNAELDEILALWHSWQKASKLTRGFSDRALVVGDYRPFWVQHESQLEQLDADLDNRRCRQVDHEVSQMADPHRTAIYCDARNLCNGIAVWSSPRLPESPEARAVVVKYARWFLVKRLISAGVM